MLRIMGKLIDVENSPLLLTESFASESLGERWTIYGGEWWVEDGWLTGKNPENAPGMIVSKDDFPGNVLLDFEARTVAPCTHDIDVMWNGSWDEEKNQRGMAYVAGVEGWWEGKVGIEKSPDYGLTVCTPLFDFIPGRTYRIQCGSINGHCFIFIDGKLALEVTDPNPIDSQKYARIGFEAYCSFIQIRNLQLRRISWEAVIRKYDPEF
jgi:hypothetical protein